ncbi:MAG: tRNA uridine-5-carboxymethylaminomethyl(34) synthesis GTPase MnmE [Gammaproteobacteria bacterium]
MADESTSSDTIVAIATPPGRGGIGILRCSGPAVKNIAEALTGSLPAPRFAHYTSFRDPAGILLDQGIVLYFPAPASYTGEDVLELQGHGGTAVLQQLQTAAIAAGARPARPGEFTERAFLNNKLDLLQAEATADLIESASATAARSALRSLQGVFSTQVSELQTRLTDIRVSLEGWLDFPDEEIDAVSQDKLNAGLLTLQTELLALLDQAKQGRLLRDGIDVVIVGAPNVGKSSLINRLAGYAAAIVTEIPGTTRDPIHASCLLEGLQVEITDTAGLRDSDDVIEQEGIRRARVALEQADIIVQVFTDTALADAGTGPLTTPRINVRNKIDLTATAPYREAQDSTNMEIGLSALTGAGLELLVDSIKQLAGFRAAGEATFIARDRHITALAAAHEHIGVAQAALIEKHNLELIAEELRLAQHEFATLTGEFTADDLLGEIFSRFCIGK